MFVFLVILIFLTGCQQAGDLSVEFNNGELAGRDESMTASTVTVVVIEELLEPWQIAKQLLCARC
jgi:hypothetical protein